MTMLAVGFGFVRAKLGPLDVIQVSMGRNDTHPGPSILRVRIIISEPDLYWFGLILIIIENFVFLLKTSI